MRKTATNKGVTQALQDTLDFVAEFAAREGKAPQQAEIAANFGISVPAAHFRVHRLKDLGLLSLERSRPRTVEIVAAA